MKNTWLSLKEKWLFLEENWQYFPPAMKGVIGFISLLVILILATFILFFFAEGKCLEWVEQGSFGHATCSTAPKS